MAEAIKKKIYLASTSPRRISILKELLEPFHLSFKSVTPAFEEIIKRPGPPPQFGRKTKLDGFRRKAARRVEARDGRQSNGLPPVAQPKELVAANAKGKVTSLQSEVDRESLLIGADTVVSIGDDIIGKPENKNEARESLKKLSGRSHSVFTGVAILDIDSKKFFEGYEETIVTFRDLTNEDIEWYVSTGEPLDKAGAYGIQGLGEMFVEKLDGSFSNVVGLPKRLTLSLLKQSGLSFGRR